MAAPARPDPLDLPQSPYAAELRQADPDRRFSAPLEAQYICADLLHERALIRTVTLCAALLAIMHGTEQVIHEPVGPVLLGQLGTIAAISVLLAILAWSPAMERRYLPWACVLVPLRNLLASLHMTDAVAHGQLALLMTLPVMVISPFFFFGLRWRIALLSGAIALASFDAGALLWHLPVPIVWRASLYMLCALITGAIAARQLGRRSRVGFLESHLLAELARRDALTGAMNRRVFNQHLARVWQQAADNQPAANQLALAILLIDVDHFKAYNDRYGHLAGDEALRRVAQAVQALVQRPDDLLARYGGEEFGVILYDVTRDQAWTLAERARRVVMQLGIEHRSSRVAGTITISIGVAVVEPKPERSCWNALQLADLALYEAKTNGRNCIDLMDDAEYRLLSRAAPAPTATLEAVG